MAERLTKKEKRIVEAVLTRVGLCMEYDESIEAYSDGDRFILTMSKDEYKMLGTAYQKLHNNWNKH